MNVINENIKLSISFENWRECGEKISTPLVKPVKNAGRVNFNTFWLKRLEQGIDARWVIILLSCKLPKPASLLFPKISGLLCLSYGRKAYGKFLRKLSEKLGVKHFEGMIQQMNFHTDTGFTGSL